MFCYDVVHNIAMNMYLHFQELNNLTINLHLYPNNETISFWANNAHYILHQNQYIHSRKLNRIQSTNTPTSQGWNTFNHMSMLWTFTHHFNRTWSNINNILWRYTNGQRTQWYTKIQHVTHLLLRRTGGGGTIGIKILLGCMLQRTEFRVRELWIVE